MKLQVKCILVTVFIAAALFAQGLVAAEAKVAFVHLQTLLAEAPQIKKLTDKLNSEFSARINKIVAQQRQIRKLEEKLRNDGKIMSDGEVKKLERDIVSRNLKLKNARSELEQERRLRQNEELDRLRKVVSEVITQIAKEEKLDMVLEDGVAWVSGRANITDKVLQRMVEVDRSGN